MRLLFGGSPCTHWSIAQTRSRETKPEGLGWELFRNYLIAKDRYKPDFFLYENNKSMAPAIRAQISRELGVEPILINSALVSAQNRQRLYWTNIPGVKQPRDRGLILLYFFKGMKDAKVAPLVHMSRPTVSRRRKAAMKRLRELMEVST